MELLLSTLYLRIIPRLRIIRLISYSSFSMAIQLMESSVLYRKCGLICASSARISAFFCRSVAYFTSFMRFFTCTVIWLKFSAILPISSRQTTLTCVSMSPPCTRRIPHITSSTERLI